MSINQVLLPGDKLPRELKGTIKVGPGLFQVNNDLVSFKAGFFQKKENKVWLENNQKRYVPALNDPVVGFIIGKTSDYYRVDIGGAHPATLPILAFENATKRSHPSLEVNAIIYGKVTLANKDMEPELECLLPGFGPLNSSLPSFTTQISLFLARMLISDRHPLLSSIGELFPFEVC
ncbi:exosome non-catalytic core subunit rrp40 [Clydaea vesicula]|uniref:Exosome non-catalytic core subunit rrp40 n=1 Tax=Clydaea vesicula TaxID=447962 RepID=A0AAD5Y1Q5_9FUNG|nr:exosome non-catalytic core subunit rrp40 [Clydaea vesicula]